MRLVIAAFWTDTDDEETVDAIVSAMKPVALPRSGGVATLVEPPDVALRQTLRSIEGLEEAADYA